MLSQIRLFIRWLYGDKPMTVDRWAEQNSKLCSADEIIAAAVMKSIAMNYDDWKYTTTRSLSSSYETKILTHSIRDTTVTVSWSDNRSYNIQNTFTINGIEVDDEIGQQIRQAYLGIMHSRQRAKAAADRALAEQKRIEAAWNLAETLLGMKRNEHGALVPVNTVEG